MQNIFPVLQSGTGIAFVPMACNDYVDVEDIKVVKIKESIESISARLMWKRTPQNQSARDLFLDIAHQYVEK